MLDYKPPDVCVATTQMCHTEMEATKVTKQEIERQPLSS
jgi:hypothetical protein